MRGFHSSLAFACLLLRISFAATLLPVETAPDLQLKPDSDSLVDLTHWTTQGFMDAGITNQTDDSRVVFQLAPADLSIQAALNSSTLRSPVIFVTSKAPPRRRKPNQPFLTVIANDADTATEATNSLPVNVLNIAATGLEKITGRRLFPYRIIASTAPSLSSGQAPFVIYDVSRGDIHVSKRFVHSWADVPSQLNATFHDVLDKVIGKFQTDLTKNGTARSSAWIENLVTMATATITNGVMATITTRPPVWFCFVCPIVLGEFFPFFFNLGLGHIAQLVCDRYHLPDDECLDLWLGAVALALILSLSSVVAIISICRIRECAKPNLR